jgi:hypothetical protein
LDKQQPDQLAISRLLWQHHERKRLELEWEKWQPKGTLPAGMANPIEVWSNLRENTQTLRVGVQSVLHGDLNPTNVAMDVGPEKPQAYIFDASGTKGGVSSRDLAMLEVTSLLHAPTGSDEDLVGGCAPLYGVTDLSASLQPPSNLSNRAKNTWTLISSIRKCASAHQDYSSLAYSVLVLDHALIQLGGLAFTVSRNKIVDPRKAAELAAYAAGLVFRQLRDRHRTYPNAFANPCDPGLCSVTLSRWQKNQMPLGFPRSEKQGQQSSPCFVRPVPTSS